MEINSSKIKSFLTVLFSGCLLFSAIPLSSCGQNSTLNLCETDRKLNAYVYSSSTNSDGGSDGLAYYVDTSTNQAVVSLGSCTATNVSIPTTYNTTYTVVGVKDSGFANDTTLTSVTFVTPSNISLIGSQAFANTAITSFRVPTNVTRIEPSTFMNCRKLATLNYGNSSTDTSSTCTYIGDNAFMGDVLLDLITFPAGFTEVGNSAFKGCVALPRAIFPATFTTLGDMAFEDCTKLGLVYFQKNIASIGSLAFKNCPSAWIYFAQDLPTNYAATGQWWNYVSGSSSISTPTGSCTYVKIYTNKSSLNYDNDGGFYYSKDDTDSRTTGYDVYIILYDKTLKDAGNGTVDVALPATVTDDDGTHKVVGISASAFEGHDELNSITWSANLKVIGTKAFYECSYLSNLNLEGATALTTIGDYAFTSKSANNEYYSSLTSLTIPNKVTSIGEYAFAYYMNLNSLTFAATSSVTTIGKYAFYDDGFNITSNFASLTLPASVTSINEGAFSNCRFVSSLSLTSTSSLTIGSQAFIDLYYLTSLSLPSISGSSTVEIGFKAFGLSSTFFNVNITSLHSVYLGSNISKVKSSAFINRLRLTIYAYADARPTSTWDGNFNYVNSIGLGDSVTSNSYLPVYYGVCEDSSDTNYATKKHLFHYSDSTNGEFDFVQNEVSIGDCNCTCTRYYFDGSNSVSLTPTIPDTITVGTATWTPTIIGNNAFIWSTTNANSGSQSTFTTNADQSLTKVTVPNTITNIGECAFATCPLLTNVSNGTDYNFSTTLTSIGDSAFAYSGLLKVYLPSGITSLGTNPFLGCFQMTVLQLGGDSVTNGQTFYSDNNNIYQALNTTTTTATDHYNSLLLGASGASTFNGEVTDKIAWGCKTTSTKCYRGQRKVEKILFPYTLTTIGSYFIDSIGSAYDATNQTKYNSLTSVRFYGQDGVASSALTKIEDIAFWGCKKLQTMELPNSLTTIGTSVFVDCEKLEYLPNDSTSFGVQGELDLSGTSITAIGDETFSGCKKLTTVKLPGTLTTINAKEFNNCSSLANLTINSGTETIGDNAFLSCSSLAAVSLPSSVVSIGSSSFNGDRSIASFVINNNSSTFTIGLDAFTGCTGLKSIVIPKLAVFSNVDVSTKFGFNGCTGLVNGSMKDGETTGVFLNMTGTEYSSYYGNNLPSGWNYVSVSSRTGYACHATTKAEATCSADANMKYWHYVSGVPTYGVGEDS